MPDKRDTYQVITDAIVAALEKCGPCERPWVGPSLTMPVNAVTGHAYRGTNILMLWVAAHEAGYAVNQWATFKQWTEKGAQVRKGEKGTPVIWFQMLDRKDADKSDDDAERRIPCARLSWAFNVAQVDGYAAEAPRTEADNAVSAIALADQLVAASGADIIHEGTQAYYVPSRDKVVMPPAHLFTGTTTSTATESYYSTLLHELTHWTAPRLKRDLCTRFGEEAYAAEELIAELSAAFLCATLGIAAEPRPDHASYIATWIRVLKDDSKAIVTAASKASEAADFLQGFLQAKHQEAA
jgi:antirestriction protein ArdC